MGASPRRIRRLHIPAALALVLVLAGSTNQLGGPHDHETAALAAATPTPTGPSQASVTVVDPQRYPMTVPAEALPPAVHIAAAGPQVAAPVRVDIADVLLDAYRNAAASVPAGCHLPVSLLAAIGQVESGSLVGRPIDAQHRTSVLGPVLNGTGGFAAIPDTDGGRWDGNAQWDRAMGPMQFIPSTWARFGVDADGDGVADPQDVEDASGAAAAYLCYGGRDLSRPADLRSAVLSYNHSQAYLRLVLTYRQRFAGLGLDDGRTVSGLQTTLALVATPLAGTDGWSSTLAKAAAAPAPADHAKKPAKAATSKAGTGTSSAPVPGKGGETPSAPASSPAPSSSPTPSAPSSSPTDPATTQCPQSDGSTTTGGPSSGPTDGPTAGPTDGPTDGPTADPTERTCPTPTATATPSAVSAPSASDSAAP